MRKLCPACYAKFIFPKRANKLLQCPTCTTTLVLNDKNWLCLFSLIMIFIFPLTMLLMLDSEYVLLLSLPGELIFGFMYWSGIKYELKQENLPINELK